MSEPFWTPLGGQPVDYEGEWAAGTQYAPGDVVTYNGVNYLAVNPSLGLEPTPASGKPPAMELIEEIDLTVNGAFAVIPPTFDSLRLLWQARHSPAVTTANLYLRCNGVVTGAYDYALHAGNGSAITFLPGGGLTEALLGVVPGNNAASTAIGTGEIVIPGYSLPTHFKTWSGRYACFLASDGGNMHVGLCSGRFFGSTGPITSLSLIGHGGGVFAVGRAWLYGLRGA